MHKNMTTIIDARRRSEAPSGEASRGSGGLFRLSEVTGALSHALDLTEGQPVGHSQRSCMIALELAARLHLDPTARQDLYYAMLLKDAGCSTTAARICEIFGADDIVAKSEKATIDVSRPSDLLKWISRASAAEGGPLVRASRMMRTLRDLAHEGRGMAETRCERGAGIVHQLGFSAAAAETVKTLGERWDGRGMPNRLKGDQIPLLSRIASVAQAAEVFASAEGPQAALDVVAERRGRWFDPEVADAFLSIGPDDSLWGRLAADSVAELLVLLEPSESQSLVDEDGLDRVAEAFADVIDAKSPFTARHSRDVARYAVAIGEAMGFSAPKCRVLRRAALLHDIGKLGISNAILDKPGKLTDDEFAEVRRHPFHSEQILGQVTAFADIAPIAAAHHERLDGRGYHRGVGADQLTPAMRALTCADVFDALTAERPYRGPMDASEALAIMWKDAATAFCPAALGALDLAVRSGAVAAGGCAVTAPE
jgi:HD-GYP domain-containing protein (c-di-GMP phosphodiesterase class II)